MAETPTPMELLVASAKGWLRIATNSRDDEIRQVCEACLIDLKNGGVAKRNYSEDSAIQQAIKLYLKSQFGYDQEAEKFDKAYEHLKAALALSGDYNVEDPDGETG